MSEYYILPMKVMNVERTPCAMSGCMIGHGVASYPLRCIIVRAHPVRDERMYYRPRGGLVPVADALLYERTPCAMRGCIIGHGVASYCEAILKHDGLITMAQHSVFQMQTHPATEHHFLHILPLPHHIFHAVSVADAHHILVDDGASI